MVRLLIIPSFFLLLRGGLVHKDSNPVKRLVYIGTQYDDKYVSRELKKEGYRQLTSVKFDGNNVELTFSREFDYKPKKRVLQLSKKKHPNIKKRDINNFLEKEKSSETWEILETIEFPNKWLIFLTR